VQVPHKVIQHRQLNRRRRNEIVAAEPVILNAVKDPCILFLPFFVGNQIFSIAFRAHSSVNSSDSLGTLST
jgi:hypothetical protein